MVTPVSAATEPAKLDMGGDKLGFTADHGDNRTPGTRYCRGNILPAGVLHSSCDDGRGQGITTEPANLAKGQGITVFTELSSDVVGP